MLIFKSLCVRICLGTGSHFSKSLPTLGMKSISLSMFLPSLLSFMFGRNGRWKLSSCLVTSCRWEFYQQVLNTFTTAHVQIFLILLPSQWELHSQVGTQPQPWLLPLA